ncbi:ATP-dependent DNA helicase [Evansella sp. AB-rgal1]|uniref:ATP-dependent DNA helicase n=1 Tax=Evansella sp. AB-rgal1 TaxID=3242696 RepID=UPI00359E1DA9
MKKTTNLPFSTSKTENFFDKLGEFIGDVFYDILPEQGYELRDEQIFMAFQVEQAFKNKNIIFAEAGVGTGKTFVYLLYAICYARYMRKPAIISCADETLIEQLVKKGGDIEKLEKALDLHIDVRLAKSRDQYICVKKVDQMDTKENEYERLYDTIPSFVFNSSTSMNEFTPYGDRKEFSWLTNDSWKNVAWDPIMQCSTCDWRHRCGQSLHRQYYREAVDLIVCSHDFYMEHVWTKESRKREGQLSLLPEASCVVFDEGHLLEFSAQKGLTYRFHSETLKSILTNYLSQDVREESLYLIEDILVHHEEWFELLEKSATSVEGSNRHIVPSTPEIISIAGILHKKVSDLLDQLVFDSELFVMEDYHLKIIEEYLEFFSYGLSILLKDDQGIYWLEQDKTETSFVIMPRLVEDVLRKEVFSQPIPFLFSSATMSRGGDFSYIASSLGIEDYTSFTVSSPFSYEEKMILQGYAQITEKEKWIEFGNSLRESNGKTLILFSSSEEMDRFRLWSSKEEWPFPILYEGDEEISKLVTEFQFEEASVLCSFHLWEGLDIPGPSLSKVIISSLPFPPRDPVFDSKRKHSKDPIWEVDVPYMLLRLRQGIGRLIRTANDEGIVQLWFTSEEKETYEHSINEIVPTEITWINL